MSPGIRCGGFAMAAVALALGACAGAPKKTPPPQANAANPAPAAPASGKKVSPYAPAQEDPGKRGDYVAGGLYAPGVRDSVPTELPDFDAIPEPEVVDEPRSRVGNRSSYQVLGKTYRVMDSAQGYVETGIASYYGTKFHGRRTSNLEVYDMYTFSAAHKTLPLPSFARVTNLDNGKSVVVRVNDRGPFHEGRVIDLSYAAAAKLGYVRKGTARVEVRALTPGDREPVWASERNNPPAPDPGATAAQAIPNPPAAADTALDRLVAAIPVGSAAAAERVPLPGGKPSATVPGEYRFDMRQDGRTMSADEFDAWMKARQVRIATGRPGPAARPADVADGGEDAGVPPSSGSDVAPATSGPASPSLLQGERIVLQVAAFSARQNADRALAMLRDAGIAEARLAGGDAANGQKVWRLRVGPLDAASAPGLAERIAGLGFGPPRRVAE